MRNDDSFMLPDLYESRSLESVAKNILALGNLAATLPDYHGPTFEVREGHAAEKGHERAMADAAAREAAKQAYAERARLAAEQAAAEKAAAEKAAAQKAAAERAAAQKAAFEQVTAGNGG